MIHRRKAVDFMTDKVIIAKPANTYSEVIKLFSDNNIQHLPVVDGIYLAGILSIKDVMAFTVKELQKGSTDMNRLNETFKVADVMTPKPVVVDEEATLKEVLAVLDEGKFHAVPVAINGILRGIISNKDITRIYHYDATHPLL